MQEHRIKQVHIGQRILTTPTLFVSYRLGDYPQAGLRCFPWKMTETEALLINAYDLLANRRCARTRREIEEKGQTLKEHLQFDKIIMMDSGAYNFLQHDEININPLDILRTQECANVDLGVVLDHPFPPDAKPEEVRARLDRTIANTKAMYQLKVQQGFGIELLPVVHGHTHEIVLSCIERLRATVTTYDGDLRMVGIGSLAPLARNGSRRKLVDILLGIRQLLPDAYIHCFSLGSALHMPLAFYCGVDSVDSQSWILGAGFKYVQLPGYPSVRLSTRQHDLDPDKYKETIRKFKAHLRQLHDEEGFIVKDWETGTPIEILNDDVLDDYIEVLTDKPDTNESIHYRACHNLWVYNSEAKTLRRAIEKGTLETVVAKRLGRRYRKVFEYAKERRSNPEMAW